MKARQYFLLAQALLWPGTHPLCAASLGTTNLAEGPSAGSDSVVLAESQSWTAAPNAAWLHLSSDAEDGTGSTNIIFSFDENPGATRTGTLTIDGLTQSITQAGSAYVAAATVTTLVGSGLNEPAAVAVDGEGNVYIADTGNNAIKEWYVASQTVTNLISSGLLAPLGVAVDGAGNVYIADGAHSELKEWHASSRTVTVLVSSGLSIPSGLALDAATNVYIADAFDNAIKVWQPDIRTMTTLVSGLNEPEGVSVDVATNVYIADTLNGAIKEWQPETQTITSLVTNGLDEPGDAKVDSAGNVYIADYENSAVKEWQVIGQNVVTLVGSGLNHPNGLAVDSANNIYIADYDNNAIKELTRAWVDPTPRSEPGTAGSDTLGRVTDLRESQRSICSHQRPVMDDFEWSHQRRSEFLFRCELLRQQSCGAH